MKTEKRNRLRAASPGAATRAELSARRDLRLILYDGISYSVMVGIGESYIAAFALALHLGEVVAGLSVTLPMLGGGLLQLVTPQGVRLLGSHRRWTILCAATQAASFLPLIAGSLAGSMPAWLLFAAAALYWGSGMSAGAAWNVWVERLVPRRVRMRYFARRNSLIHFMILVGLLGGAAALELAGHLGWPLLGFAAVFGTAAVARSFSAGTLALQRERAIPAEPAIGEQMKAMIVEFRSGEGGKLLAYLLAFTTTVTISSPFFSPYMLARLEFSYWTYMGLIGTSLLAKSLMLTLLARFSRRLKLIWLLRTAWLGIVPLPALWLVSSSFAYLAGLQIVSGSFWAIQEYAAFLLLFETIPARRRVAVLTIYNIASATATVGGSLLGATLLHFGARAGIGYTAIFAASSALRGACLMLLLRVRSEKTGEGQTILRPVAIRPGMGTIMRPILGTLRRSRVLRKPRR